MNSHIPMCGIGQTHVNSSTALSSIKRMLNPPTSTWQGRIVATVIR